MSFTAEVKDELSRIEGPTPTCALAELSALMRVCGTLSFHGAGRYSLRIATETGSVARTTMGLVHKYLNLRTTLTVRRSVQRKSRNYLIEIPPQDKLDAYLVALGILVPGHGLASGVPAASLDTRDKICAFVRGAFMAGGFVADPRGDFHLEIAVTGEGFAQGIVDLVQRLGVNARLNHRRGSYAVYLKSYDEVRKLLDAMGAVRSARTVDKVRQMKNVKNEVNRRVNAELANGRRSSRSGADQIHLIGRVANEVGLKGLSPKLREFCELRLKNPEMSLADLGRLCDPPASKSAMYHRVLRLQELVKDAKGEK
jgi:DNA-binding protein WhiA